MYGREEARRVASLLGRGRHPGGPAGGTELGWPFKLGRRTAWRWRRLRAGCVMASHRISAAAAGSAVDGVRRARWSITIGRTRSFPGQAQITGLLGNALGYRHQGRRWPWRRYKRCLLFAAALVRPGEPLRDYHTVDLGQPHLTGTGWTTRGCGGRSAAGASGEATHIRHRWYLADALVLVALTLAPDDLAPRLDDSCGGAGSSRTAPVHRPQAVPANRAAPAWSGAGSRCDRRRCTKLRCCWPSPSRRERLVATGGDARIRCRGGTRVSRTTPCMNRKENRSAGGPAATGRNQMHTGPARRAPLLDGAFWRSWPQ